MSASGRGGLCNYDRRVIVFEMKGVASSFSSLSRRLSAAAPESVHLLRRHLKQSWITAGSVFRGDARYGGECASARLKSL